MNQLWVIRHGQASFLADDYDQLSPLGIEQGRALGTYWAARGITPSRVVIGPRRRHQQTADAASEVFREQGLDWPEETQLDELDEHDGQEIVNLAVPGYVEDYPELADRSKPEGRRRYFELFRRITRAWARGEEPTPSDLEPWAAFRARVERGIRSVIESREHAGEEGITAVFTSGGPVATATGMVLGLPDEKVLELSWVVRNAALAEIRCHSEGLTLHAFNTIDHLSDPRLVSYI